MISNIGKLIIFFGIILIAIGIISTLGAKINWLGRLPGDIYVQKKNFTFYFPLATCIIVSIVISLILTLLRRR